ncbi:hypothetical protein [Ornithinimicrobium cerasi]|uniref:hypothetical protein n=1 Tax=Ornithinimicrobium cerasi TaxID=2248773 RepID=UPI00137A9C7E|nr:hypothetical protein [Ornithinimicrobium cerasi]
MSRVAVLTGMTLTLALVGCAQASDDPSATPATEVQPSTSAPAAGVGATATPEPTDGDDQDATSEEPTSTAGEPAEDEATDAAYPQDADAYLDDLIAAWAGGDTDRVAALVSPAVEAGISAWGIPAEGWEPSSTNPATPHELTREHPTGGSITAFMDTGSLGGEAAVVDLRFTVGDPALRRADSALNAYVDTFHTAIIEQDVPTLERYATPDVVAAATRYSPDTHGSRITDLGFVTGAPDGNLTMTFDYPDKQPDERPDADPFHMHPQLLVLDPDVVLDGGDHGVVHMGAWIPGP